MPSCGERPFGPFKGLFKGLRTLGLYTKEQASPSIIGFIDMHTDPSIVCNFLFSSDQPVEAGRSARLLSGKQVQGAASLSLARILERILCGKGQLCCSF